MKTRPLYYDDPTATEFSATVVDVRESNYGTVVVLDQTLFYPEGGGQPADRGRIGHFSVKSTQKDTSGEILHILGEDIDSQRVASELARGTKTSGTIDWSHRFEYMQQHSGQHILSAALKTRANADTVSVHQGADVTTIEIDRESFSDREVETVEDVANAIIRERRPIKTFWVGHTDLGNYALRRPTKLTGKIRLVEIDGWDLVACGGVHTVNTADVQLVLCTGIERIRGRLRLAFRIGSRAIADYRLKDRVVRSLVDTFSAQPEEIPDRIAGEQDQIRELKRSQKKLNERLGGILAGQILGSSGPVCREYGEHPETFNAMVQIITEDSNVRACLVNRESDKRRFAVVIGTNLSVAPNDFRDRVLNAGSAKGGGRPPLWQGVVTGDPDALFSAFEKMASQLSPPQTTD